MVRVSMFPVVLCGGLLVGCGDSGVGEIKVGGVEDSGGVFEDEDGDGFGVDDGDCDDQDGTIGPGAEDVVGDGIDQNCDGLDGVDDDRDGVASVESGGGDCDDGDSSTYPGADETCDGTDDDCDGVVDEDDAIDAVIWYRDSDSDGSGDSASFEIDCDAPEGFVRNGTDCDDNDPSRESLDGDGDGFSTCEGDCDDSDAALVPVDSDGDGYSSCEGDCADSDPELNPADEDGDGFSSCDGDCDDADAGLNLSDRDGDGYSTCDEDCDDSNDSINSDATDGLFEDRNCDARIDVSVDAFSQKIVGDAEYQSAGYSAQAAGDVDGDGLVDFVIGAPGDKDGGNASGAAYLLMGATLGSSSVSSLADADYKFVGENTDDGAGFRVVGGGDIDGDGLDDILFSAYGEDTGAQNAGAVYVVLAKDLGTETTLDLRYVTRKILGEDTNNYAGWALSFAGDVDGDGLDDVLIGAPYNGEGGLTAGAAYIVLGRSLAEDAELRLEDADYRLIGERVGDFAGYSVDSLGDVDGDGLDDVIIGAPYEDENGNESGASYVVLGASMGIDATIDLSNADYKIMGEGANETSGFSVSGAGDVDGDGLDDVLIGASYNSDGASYGGAVYVVLGGSLGQDYEISLADSDYKLVGVVNQEYAGSNVESIGDVDGDGLDDFLVSAPSNIYAKVAGTVYLVLAGSLPGSSTLSLANADGTWTGTPPVNNGYGTGFGSGLAAAGDLDGDGLGDVLIGAPGDSDGGLGAGAVLIGLSSD